MPPLAITGDADLRRHCLNERNVKSFSSSFLIYRSHQDFTCSKLHAALRPLHNVNTGAFSSVICINLPRPRTQELGLDRKYQRRVFGRGRIATLSAPARNNFCTSSDVRTPPPTVIGTNTSLAALLTISVKLLRP